MSSVEGDKSLMSQRQLQRWHLMGLVEGGKITLKEASDKIGVSYRQPERTWKAVKNKGIPGLIHANVSRPLPNRFLINKKYLQKTLDSEIRL
jgi:hypothetical protein